MRILAGIAVALLLGCGGGASAKKPDPALAHQSPDDDATRWRAIEELARPAHTGTSQALAGAAQDQNVEALVAWMRESGGLPPRERGGSPHRMELYELGKRAIERATNEDWEPVAAGGYLGLRLVQDGASLLDATMGIALLEAASRKLRALGDPADGLELPHSTDLARMVAAEALFAREMIALARTPEGREMYASIGVATDDQTLAALDALGRFWLDALAGARRDEPAEVTLDRMRRAAETPAAAPAKKMSESTIRAFADIVRSIDELH